MRYLLLFLLSCGAAFFSSCKKHHPTPAAPPHILQQFAMKLNGVFYSASFASVQESDDQLTVQTVLGQGQIFELSVAKHLSPGTYVMNTGSPVTLLHSDDDYTTTYHSTSGELTIVSNDTVHDHLSGTYSCTLTRANPAGSKTVTQAEFNVDY